MKKHLKDVPADAYRHQARAAHPGRTRLLRAETGAYAVDDLLVVREVEGKAADGARARGLLGTDALSALFRGGKPAGRPTGAEIHFRIAWVLPRHDAPRHAVVGLVVARRIPRLGRG